MPNPYNITEVDVPGVLGAYQNQQDRRVQRLMAERQVQVAEREMDRQDKASAALEKFYQDRERAAGAQGGAAGAAQAYSAAQAPGVPTAAPQQAPAPAQAAYDPWDDPTAQQELVRSLTVLDLPQAMQLREAFREHSTEERKQSEENWANIGQAALQLRQLPPQDRPAAFQAMLPMLRSLNIGEDVLQQVDLSDQGLENAVNMSRDIEKVIAGFTPEAVPVSGVGLFPVTPGSPYPDFNAGGERPSAQIGGAVQPPPEAVADLRANPGTAAQFDEVFGPGAASRVLGGGGVGNGTGGFPGY